MAKQLSLSDKKVISVEQMANGQLRITTEDKYYCSIGSRNWKGELDYEAQVSTNFEGDELYLSGLFLDCYGFHVFYGSEAGIARLDAAKDAPQEETKFRW